MDAPKMKFINGKRYDVCSYEEYIAHKDYYDNSRTAIESEFNGETYVLPIRNKPMISPGVYPDGCLNFFITPTEEEKEEYSPNNIADFGNANTMKDLITIQMQIQDTQYDILTNPDNISTPRISNNDAPAMKALKEAVIEKHIDIDKYQDRFGKNFNNEKRLIYGSDITLLKLNRICKNLDIKATLTLSDTSDKIPNPIGREITIDLTGDGGNNE